MQAFEIEGQTSQTPRSDREPAGARQPFSSRPQTAQREPAEARDFLDDSDHRFNGGFAQTIDRLTNLRLQFVSHLFLGTGLIAWRLGQFGEKGDFLFRDFMDLYYRH